MCASRPGGRCPENGIYSERLSDFRHIVRSFFVREYGISVDHLQLGDLSETNEHILLDATGKIGIRRIIT